MVVSYIDLLYNFITYSVSNTLVASSNRSCTSSNLRDLGILAWKRRCLAAGIVLERPAKVFPIEKENQKSEFIYEMHICVLF